MEDGKIYGSENRRKIYENLTKDGFDLGTLEDFNRNMDDNNVRRSIYDAAKDAGWEVPEYDQFDRDMSVRRMKIGGKMQEVDHATYDDFMKRHPSGTNVKPKSKPQQVSTPKPSSQLPDSVSAEQGYTFTEEGLDSAFNQGYPVRAVESMPASEPAPAPAPVKPEKVEQQGTPWGTAGSATGQGRIYKPTAPGQVRESGDPGATQFGVPYKPDTQLTAAQRDEIYRQNDYAVKQILKLRNEETRRNQSIVDTGSPEANKSIIKPQGQWEDDLQKGASRISNSVVTPAVDKAIADFDKKADEIWGKYNEQSKFVDSASPMSIEIGRQSNEAKDPEKILNYLQQQMEGLYKDSTFAEEVGKEADKMGIDRAEYIEKIIKPQIQQDLSKRLTDTLVKRELPKSTTEYVMNGLSNSIIGMLYDAIIESKGQRNIKNQAAAMTEEGRNPYYNPGTGAKLAQMGVSFAADAPFFGIYGKVSGQVAKQVAERNIQKLVSQGLSEGAARSIVGSALENSVGARMKNYIMQHVIGGSLTMGGYNFTSEGARQLRDKEFDPMKLAGSTAEGLAVGSAFGLTGGVSQALSQPLTGFAKIGAKAAGFGAEAETMYATEELSKMIHGEEGFTNPFEGGVESLMKLGVMKLSGGHLVGKASEKILRAKEVGARQTAVESLAELLGQNKTGVKFTEDEQDYIRNSQEGKDLVESLANMHPDRAIEEVNGKKRLTKEGEQQRQHLAENYERFMSNTEIPADVKQKVSQMMGGIYRPGLETGVTIIQNEDGSVLLKTRDKDGNCVRDMKFDNLAEAEQWRDQFKSQMSRNDAVNMFNSAPEDVKQNIVNIVRDAVSGKTELDELKNQAGSMKQNRLKRQLEKINQTAEKYEGREMTDEEARNYIQTVIKDGDDAVFNDMYDLIRENTHPSDQLDTKRNYWEGQQLSAVDRHKAQVDVQLAEERLRLQGDDFAEEVIGAADYPDEKMAELAMRASSGRITGDQLKAALDYYNKTSKVRGMMDEAANDIDNQVEAANAYVRRNTHPDSGTLIDGSYRGRDYYVTAGHFQISPDGRLVPIDNSGLVILRDKETGEIETANPNDVLVNGVQDPNRLIAYNESMEGLRGQLTKEADDSIELHPDTPTDAANGDIYMASDGNMYMAMQIQDEAGNPLWAKIAIDETGNPVGDPMPFDMDEYRKAKSDEMDAADIPPEEAAAIVENRIQSEGTDNPVNDNTTDPSLGAEEAVAEAQSQGIDVQPHNDVTGNKDAAGTGIKEEPVPATEVPVSRIPVDEKGKKLYEQAKPEDTLAELTEKYGEEQAQQMISKIAESTAKALDEIQNRDTSKITDMAELEAYQDEVVAAQQKADYWKNLVKPKEPKVEQLKTEEPAASVEPEKPVEPEKSVEPEKPVTPPVEPEKPAGPTAEQKIAQGTVKNNVSKRFGFQNQDGTRSEVVIDAFKGDDMVEVTRQDYDQNGRPKGEPYKQDLNMVDVGNSIIKGILKPALSTEEKLRQVYKGKPGMQNIIDVLSDAEQRQMLDTIERGDQEAVRDLTNEFLESHREDIILNERDKRNSNVSRIMEGGGSREDKLRRVRKEYQGYDDAVLALSDEAMQPTTLEEYIADLHSRQPKAGEGPLAYFSYDQDGKKVVGMQDETGFGTKSGGDTNGFKPWLAPKGKGVSLQQYAENIHSQLPEAIQEQYSDQDVRNAILSVFGGAERPSDITTMVIRRGVIQAEQAARRMEEMWIDNPSLQKVSPDDNTFAGRLARGKQQTNTEPTEAQKEKGNYKKGHISFGGYDFTIENPAGSVRRGEDATGRKWEQKMNNTYGYILGKRGKDGDHLDFFINDKADLDNWNGNVYVVDQIKPDGSFDEHKILYGFDSEAEAREAYLSNYEKNWKGLGKITGVDKATFDKWLDASDYKIKDFADYSIVKHKVEQQMRNFDDAMKQLSTRGISIDNQELLDKYGLKNVVLSKSGDHLTLTHFIVDQQGQGYGTRFMEDLARLADEKGWTLALTPGLGFGAKSKKKLEEFYKRFGFVANKGRNADFQTRESMIRRPKEFMEKPEDQEKVIRDAIVEYLKSIGIEVSDDWQLGQKILDDYNRKLEVNEEPEDPIKSQKVTDQTELDELNNGKTVKRYRAMQLIDGKLYPPMSAKVDGEMREPTEIGVWEKAEERPDLIKNGKFVLNKGQKGQGNVPAAYNPYFHTSTSGLNDQFTSAYKRPELVVVEVEIPESELTSGYKAEGAKDAVGNVDWHSGVVNGQLPEDRQRQVTLSRYNKVNRIVPDSEVANMIAKQLEGTDVEVPYNVVTPALRAELEKRGVKISDKPAGSVTEDINGNPIPQQKFFKTPDGHAYGYTKGGKIYLDPRIATSETPVHEYDHLWCEMKRQTAPEEWDQMKQVMLTDKLVQPIIDRVKRDYPELTKEGKEDDFIEEIITQFSGKRGAERLREVAEEVAKENGGVFGKAEAVTAMQRLKNILNRFWEGVAKMMGWKYRNANQIADRMMADMLNGVDPTKIMKDAPKDLKGQQEIERTLMGVHNISEEKLKKALKQGGLANPSLAVFDTRNYAHTDYGEISLIPRSSLIDSRTGRNAGTFSGDAWTPTYPRVEKFLTKKGDKHRLKIAKEAAGGDEEMERHLAVVINDYVEGNGDRMHFLFLKQKGLNPEVRPERTTHSHEEFEEIQKIFGDGTSTLPSDGITKEQNQALLDLMTRGYEEQVRKQTEMIKDESKREAAAKVMLDRKLKDLVDENGNVWFAKGDSFVYENWRDEQRRKNPKPDWYGTDNDASYRVAKEGLAEEYEKWKEELLNDEDIDEKLFAGWTADGQKRYVSNTVQNASRLMNKEAEANAYGNGGVNASKSVLLKKLKTLSDIRKYRHLLKSEDQIKEQAQQASDEWFDIIQQVSDMQKIDSNQFINLDIAEARLQEAITERDPIGYLNKEYGYDIDRNSDLASELMNFIEKAKEMPVKYFETKFRRPVGIDEFAIAVVPSTTSPEVVEALKNAGLDVRTYERSSIGDENDKARIKATMDAVSGRDDILFQKKKKEYPIVEGEALGREEFEKFRNDNIGKSIDKVEGNKLLHTLKNNAEEMPEVVEFTDENYNRLFGNGIDTPIGHVKMSDNQKQKMSDKKRENQMALAKRTLEDPDMIIRKPSQAKEGQVTERPFSYVFVKTFKDSEGKLATYFFSVSVKKEGLEVSMSNYIPEEKNVLRDMREGTLAYIREVTLPSESGTSTQGDQSTSPAGDISSEGKDTNNIDTFQDNQEKSSDEAPKFQKTDNKAKEISIGEIKNFENDFPEKLTFKSEIGMDNLIRNMGPEDTISNARRLDRKLRLDGMSIDESYEKRKQEFLQNHKTREERARDWKGFVQKYYDDLYAKYSERDVSALMKLLNRAEDLGLLDYVHNDVPLKDLPESGKNVVMPQAELARLRKELQYLEDMTRDEQGRTIDEQDEALRQEWLSKPDIKGYGKAAADLTKSHIEKYGEKTINRLWDVQDKIKKLEKSIEDDTPKFQKVGSPEPEMTPEERQYWNQWNADMKKWRERNGIPEGVDGPGEKPAYQRGENAIEYAKRLVPWARANKIWQTAPKLEDYRQKREVKDAVETARENEKRYPDSPMAKMRRVAAEFQQIRSAMNQQKSYDKATVKAVTDFAQEFMKQGFGDHLSRGEMERMLSSVKNATGAKDIRKEVDNIMNILIDNHLRNLDQQVQKLSSTKELKQTAQGVEAQGKLELKGQRMIQAFREARQGRMDAGKIRERMNEVAEKMARDDDEAPMWEQEYEGLSLALRYQEDIEASRDEYKDLEREYKDAVADYKTSGRSYKAQQELLDSLDQAMMENKIERIGLFGDIIGRLQGNISESMEGAKEFVEREKERVNNIHRIANFDLAGKSSNTSRREDRIDRVLKNDMLQLAFSPLATFEQMLKQFGGMNVKGEGNLYNYFMRNYIDSVDKAYTGTVQARKELDTKARELFGDKIKHWSDLYSITSKPGMEITYLDEKNEVTENLSQGNMLYIYMANKMSDGKMKLRKMGITEEDVDTIKDALDLRLVELGDWLQSEYLPQKRTEYNKVHERMFGAPMAAIDNYFPIKVNRDAAWQDADKYITSEEGDKLPSSITGSIIKRTRNALPLDILHTDALSLAMEHLEDMEQWKAQAEFNRDVKDLLSYTTFRNKVKNMKTIYGSGTPLWNKFFDAATIATGDYNPKRGIADKTITNIAKGVTAAKINFRVYTAFKQILSAPAFLHDVNLGDFVKDAANPYGSWKWAMENMPVFQKRWKSRQVGDTRLMDDPTDWKMWKTNVVQMTTRMGMSPNALVDGVTCAVGARAIYETRYKKYKKIGASDEVARKRALQDAEIGYNLTQQSSEGAFVSQIQKDRTVAANMLSVFRNSSMAYTRQWVDAARNLRHRMQKGYKEDSIDFMSRQFEQQFGLDKEQAKQAAEKEYARAARHDVARLLNMMFGVTTAWNLGASLPYLLMGDDDETKKEMLTDALVKGMVAGPTEGFAAGNIWSDIIGRTVASEQTRNTLFKEGWGSAVDASLKQAGDYEVNPLPLMADIQSMIEKMGYDEYAAAQDVFNICMQSAVGVNPQTFTDMWNACMDYGNPSWMPFTKDVGNDDLSNSKEIALFIMRLMNAPTSSWRNKYIDELQMNVEDAKKLPYEEMARRYANYKHWKDAPIMGWLRSDKEREEKIGKLQKQFDKAVKERLARADYEALQDDLDNTDDEEMKKAILTTMKGQAKSLTDKDLLKLQTASKNTEERKMLTGVIKDKAKKAVSGISNEVLSDSINNTTSLDRKNAFASVYAKRQGAQDYYGKSNSNVVYQQMRTHEDIREDIQLSELYKQAKESGDEKALKAINKLRRKISAQRNKLGDNEETNTEMMKDIRAWRREALERALKVEIKDKE